MKCNLDRASWIESTPTPPISFDGSTTSRRATSMWSLSARSRTDSLRDFLRINFGWDIYEWMPGDIEF